MVEKLSTGNKDIPGDKKIEDVRGWLIIAVLLTNSFEGHFFMIVDVATLR